MTMITLIELLMLMVVLLLIIDIETREATTYIERFEDDWKATCVGKCHNIPEKVNWWMDPVSKQYQNHEAPFCKKIDSCVEVAKSCRWSSSTNTGLWETAWLKGFVDCDCCRCRCTYDKGK